MSSWPAYLSIWLGILLAAGAILRGLVKSAGWIARLVDSTEANTRALVKVTETLAALSERVAIIERQAHRNG